MIFNVILAIVLISFFWDRFLESLNNKHSKSKLPAKLEGIYDEEKYSNFLDYSAAKHKFSWFSDAFNLLVIVAMLVFKGFALADSWALAVTENPIGRGLIFFAILGLGSSITSLPFSIYSTFVIEEKFGFNKTTVKTFILDLVKGLFLGALLGGGIMALIIWFYTITESAFWLYAWALMTVFMLFITMFYTSLILPLFNKQTPLGDGELRDAIEAFSAKAGFKLDNIYVMDGSKRSTKANAFFSGFGANKRIVLYDTLIKDLGVNEIVAVLAHEVGHFKKKHVLWGTLLGIIQTGVLLYILSLFVKSPELSFALGVDEASFHIGLIAFGILYSPVSGVLGLLMTLFSRKNEYEADRFAAEYSDADDLGNALKTISVNSLSNLTPHPWFVFFHYSHPPLLQRLNAMEGIEKK